MFETPIFENYHDEVFSQIFFSNTDGLSMKKFLNYLRTISYIRDATFKDGFYKITFESEEHYTWFLMGLPTQKEVDNEL